MGYIGRPDRGIGAGTWLVVGTVTAGILYLAFRTAKGLTSHLLIRAPGRVVKLDGGSTAENRAALDAAFGADNVQDRGNGTYAISTAVEKTVTVPNGGQVL